MPRRGSAAASAETRPSISRQVQDLLAPDEAGAVAVTAGVLRQEMSEVHDPAGHAQDAAGGRGRGYGIDHVDGSGIGMMSPSDCNNTHKPIIDVAMTFASLKTSIRRLYEGATPRGVRFRYALLAFDIVTVLFIIATSFLPSSQITETLDVLFGIGILADFSARLLVSRHRLREFTRFSTWTDVIAIVSFLAPLAGEAGGFLRILRTLRLLRDYQMLVRLRADSSFFRRNEEVIFAVTNLAVFIFVMTAIVYETQKFRNDQITNYADALYFTVTALTTTGFGDITLPGTRRPPDLGRHHDFRRDPVLQSRPRAVDPEQGAISLPDLRPAAPRQRCRALQGVRRGAEYSRRGQFLTRRPACPMRLCLSAMPSSPSSRCVQL